MQIQCVREKKGYSLHIPQYRIHAQGDSFDEAVKDLIAAIKSYKILLD